VGEWLRVARLAQYAIVGAWVRDAVGIGMGCGTLCKLINCVNFECKKEHNENYINLFFAN
jgi:hypothetical protein